jgi:hypothetical protein
MTDHTDLLPSWRPGPVRDALVSFLDAADGVAVVDRVAFFDNDGTLWCERPSYVQLDFFIDALRRHVADNPAGGERAEFAALLSGDKAAIAAIGLERIAVALADLFDGLTPQEFTARVRTFIASATHHPSGRPLRSVTYQPMLELLAELRRRDFTIGIVTGAAPSSSEPSAMTSTRSRPNSSWAPSSTMSSPATTRTTRCCVVRAPCSARPTRVRPR